MEIVNYASISNEQAKDGRVRITVMLTEFIEDMTAYGEDSSDGTFMISRYYPFTNKGVNKGVYLKAFLASYEIAVKSLDILEGDMRKGAKDW